MNRTVVVLLDIMATLTIFFSIAISLIRRKSIQWLDNSFILLLLSLAFFFISNLLESTAISVALDPYENFLLPFIWTFWFFAMLKKIQLIELERAHNELKISEQKTRTLLQNLPQRIFLKNRLSEYITCNEKYASDFNRKPEEITGKTDFDFYPVEMAEKYREDDHRIIESGKAEEIDETYLLNGQKIWVHTVKTPIVDEKGRVTGILGIFWDISERKKAEENITRQNAVLSGILKVLDETLTSANEEELGSVCLSVAEKITSSEFGFIGEINNQKGILEFIAIRGLVWEACNVPDKSGHALRSGQKIMMRGLIEKVLDNETGLFTNDPITHSFYTGVPDGHPELKNFLGVPLIVSGRVIGMIGLANRPEGYSTQEAEAVRTLTPVIVKALTSKRAEKALKESEENFRAYFDNLAVGTAQIDTKGHFIKVNDRYCAITGYSREELCGGMSPLDLDLPEEREIDIERITRFFKGEASYNIEKRYVRKDGTIVWVHVTVATIRNDNNIIAFTAAIIEDITERKRAEEALLANEERLRTILNSLADAVIATDTSGVITRINPAAERLTGWQNGQAIGKPLAEVFIIGNSDSGEAIPDPIFSVLHSGTIISLAGNTKLVSRNNCTYQIADSVAPIRGMQGEITGVVLVFRDVTEEYAVRQALQESEERYRLFYETSPFALLAIKSLKLRDPNPSAVKLFGISAEELKNTPPWELSPERQPDGSLSRDKAIFYIEEALAGHPQYFEWVHQRRDGTRFDAEIALTRVNLMGEPQITATVIDITDRKNALKNLKTSLHEKETLLQEIYHRTKNNMMVISSFLELQAASVENEMVDRIIHDSITRIRTMSLAHEMLYKGKSLSRINMQEYITGLAKILATGSGISPEKVNLQFDIDKIELLIDIAIPCGLIINELLSNCFRYAFPGNRKGVVVIALKRFGEKQLEMSIKDNGVGLPDGFDIMQTDTLGVQLMTQIAQHQLHATIHLLSEHGLGWFIIFREDLYAERV